MAKLEEVNPTPKTTNGTWSRNWPGGRGVFHGNGTWDSATATLKIRHQDGAGSTALGSDTTITADGGGEFVCRSGVLDVVVSGGNESTQSLTFTIEKVY
jgi:hypothetical protein